MPCGHHAATPCTSPISDGSRGHRSLLHHTKNSIPCHTSLPRRPVAVPRGETGAGGRTWSRGLPLKPFRLTPDFSCRVWAKRQGSQESMVLSLTLRLCQLEHHSPVT